ncbi:hypothetical protein J4443_02585 [Candidatus Woesearchaeota archaeon]|nr:hypothetical protein [Candidatus Woesearchaeota archaeon]
MDKKVGVSILFGFLLLIGLVVSNAIVDSDDSPSDLLRSANISVYGGEYAGIEYENTTKGGDSEIANVTVTYGTGNNITNITVSWDANYSFSGWMSIGDVQAGNESSGFACMADTGTVADCDVAATENVTFSNVTIVNGAIGDWTCLNLSATQINCYNASAIGSLNLENTSIIIRFNVTAISNREDRSNFIINVSSNDAATVDNTTTLTTYIDGRAPTLVELNISDGNTTWENGTFNGTIHDDFMTFLSNQSNLVVTATFYEQNPANDSSDVSSSVDGDMAWLLINGTNEELGELLLTSNTRINRPIVTQGPIGSIAADASYTHAIKYVWTISAAHLNTNFTSFGTGSGNRTLSFMILMNDSFNNEITINDSNAGAQPFSISINDTLPYIPNITIEDARGNIRNGGSDTDGSSDYLSATNWTIRFDVLGATKPGNNTPITFYYNLTGAMNINNGYLLNITNFDGENDLNTSNLSTVFEVNEQSNTRSTYEYSIDANASDGNTLQFYIVLGNASADYKLSGNLPNNYTTYEGPFLITVDGTVPTATLGVPATRGITTADTIEYTCTGGDGASGVEAYQWTLIKPGGVEKIYDKESSTSGTNKKTFSGLDIGTTGSYGVKCKVFDFVDNEYETQTTGSNDFSVSISSAGAGGGGAGGGAAVVSFDVDFTTSPQATFKASQGRVKSFSFDGVTKHTITFNEVTANSVTLMIASDPITVKLNAGQSKSVDVNADGTEDMKVQLNGVANGVADVTVTKLEEGAAKIKAEEERARETTETGETREEREVTPVAGRSLAWLWWTLIVIVAIVAIGYYVNKRK